MVVPAPCNQEDHEAVGTLVPFPVDIQDVPLSAFSLGYVTTGHRFQGCEADNIIVFIQRPVSQGYNTPKYDSFVNWKHIYTSLTRAKKRVVWVSTLETLKQKIMTKVIPRRSKLFMHLGAPISSLAGLAPDADSGADRLQLLLDEMAVEGDGAGDEGTNSNKRESSDQGSGNQSRRFRSN
jgi:hypothetical protein